MMPFFVKIEVYRIPYFAFKRKHHRLLDIPARLKLYRLKAHFIQPHSTGGFTDPKLKIDILFTSREYMGKMNPVKSACKKRHRVL